MTYQEELIKRVSIYESLKAEDFDVMRQFTSVLLSSIQNGRKIMTCGNGGSAANAQHITGDIVGRYKIEREAFAGLSLTVDPSVMTATGNDYGYEEVFARQVEGLGQSGDTLIVLSSSAHSPNIKKAVMAAKKKEITTLAVLGNDGGSIVDSVDHALTFKFSDSDLVEETAMAIFHIVLMDLEQQLTNKK